MAKFGSYLETNESGILKIEGQSVVELAKKFGTPMFVLSENTIRHNFRLIRNAFSRHYPGGVEVCVGMKGNWGLAARRVIVTEGGSSEVFGLGELTIALLAGADPSRMVMNGPNKTVQMHAGAIEAGVLIQYDNMDELEDINHVAANIGKTARVSARIRLPLEKVSDVVYKDPRFKDGINPGPWSRSTKFGMEPQAWFDAIERALSMEHVLMEGLMYHGGPPRRAGLQREETEDLFNHIGEVKRRFGWEPKYVNVGGGYVPERYGLEPPASTIDEACRDIAEEVVKGCEKYGLQLPILQSEPGRFCWESAGMFIVKAGNIKADQNLTDKKWIYVDGNINEMGDPFDPNSAFHHVVIANDANREGSEVQNICGQLCHGLDFLATDRAMAPIQTGDLLAVLDMGAYNEAFACQSNAMPRSPTVMVSGDRATVVRRRETVQDVISRDAVPTWLMTDWR
jgi:diaminopimelate decarboxylase